VAQATVLVGSDRHLSYFPDHAAQCIALNDFQQAIAQIRQVSLLPPPNLIVVLTSGDPLFFGLGRLLLTELPAESLTFHPHLSAVQLAFSRVKLPWQDARLISAHGRSLEELTQALQQGAAKLAVLTDGTNTPATIARLLGELDLASRYQLWVGENLGSPNEQVQLFSPKQLIDQTFAPLNVVVLLRSTADEFDLSALPAFGLPDSCFVSFSDRPGLMTKREVRILVLGELALRPHQVVWDIGAGTGSVSIEIARLFPSSQVYAIEKTAAGISLIQQNLDRLQVKTVVPRHGLAPAALKPLPPPDRVFVGGSGGNLDEILDFCQAQVRPDGIVVLAIATLEHLQTALSWVNRQAQAWNHRLLQVQLSRSVAVAALTRFAPLNPVTLLTLEKAPE
jgi:precorrin-6Y C5,15-methyltransferase (decarboxylating)